MSTRHDAPAPRDGADFRGLLAVLAANPRLGGRAVRALLAIAARADSLSEEVAFRPAELEAASGLDERTLRHAVADLEAAGVLEVARQGHLRRCRIAPFPDQAVREPGAELSGNPAADKPPGEAGRKSPDWPGRKRGAPGRPWPEPAPLPGKDDRKGPPVGVATGPPRVPPLRLPSSRPPVCVPAPACEGEPFEAIAGGPPAPRPDRRHRRHRHRRRGHRRQRQRRRSAATRGASSTPWSAGDGSGNRRTGHPRRPHRERIAVVRRLGRRPHRPLPGAGLGSHARAALRGLGAVLPAPPGHAGRGGLAAVEAPKTRSTAFIKALVDLNEAACASDEPRILVLADAMNKLFALEVKFGTGAVRVVSRSIDLAFAEE